MLLPSGAKPAAGTPLKLASSVSSVQSGAASNSAGQANTAQAKKPLPDRSLLAADAINVALPQRSPERDALADNTSTGASHIEASHSPEAAALEPPPLPANQSNASSLTGVLSAKAVVPALSLPVSQGVAGGQLLRRVAPVYPSQANLLRLEGRVILSALVMEDGSVRDLKIVQGQPTLAQAAIDAVKQWRYQPFTLDGKPVKRETTVTVDFKRPAN